MGEQIREQFLMTYQGVVDSLISWTPRVLLAIVLLISALVVAKVIERILRAEGGRVYPAAERLGIPVSTLYKKIKRYGLGVSRD